MGAIKYYDNPFKIGELFLKGWPKISVFIANRERIPVHVKIQKLPQQLHEAHSTNTNDDLRYEHLGKKQQSKAERSQPQNSVPNSA